MNIFKQIVTVILDPNVHEQYLLGFKEGLRNEDMRFDSAAVEYYRGREDAYAALEGLGAEVEQ